MTDQTPDRTRDLSPDQPEQTRPLSSYQQDPEPPTARYEPQPDPAPAAARVEAAPERPASRRHRLEVTYLVVGVVFLGTATSWLLRHLGVVGAGDDAWYLPLTLVLAGAVGLAAWVASTWRRDDGDRQAR